MLTDGFILNAAFNQTTGVVKDSMARVYSGQLLDKYEVSREIWESNVDYLYADPVRLDTIFERMLDRLDYLQDSIASQ